MRKEDLMPLHSLYSIKSDRRKKVRTVLGATKERIAGQKLDVGRTYSPTARHETLRLLCSIAHDGLVIRGGDVIQAYTLAAWPTHLKKALTRMPTGYEEVINGIRHCVKVGNLYGHPIAGRNWWNSVKRKMLSMGCKQSQYDPCLFYKMTDGDTFYFLVYVDDVLTFSTPDSGYCRTWKQAFEDDYDWNDFDTDLREYNSVHIIQSEGAVSLGMERYITDMWKEYYGDADPHHTYNTPADIDLADAVYRASVARDVSQQNTPMAKKFRTLVMKLLYLAILTRPDILTAVNLLTRVQAWPNADLMRRAERVLIYAHSTKHLRLTYVKDAPLAPQLHLSPRVVIDGFSDASFARAHSTTGALIKACGAGIWWATQKQATIALSPYEAEVQASSACACQLVWYIGLMEEIGHKQDRPTRLYIDNKAAIDLAHDPMMHEKSKHIDRKHLYLRELVEEGKVAPEKVASEDNPSDALSKPLARGPAHKHRDSMLGLQVHK